MDKYNHPSATGTQETDLFNEQPIYTYASFWLRLGAAILDGLILFIPLKAFEYLLGNEGISNIINIVAGWLYSALLESSPQQATLGKKAVGIKVISIEGQTLTFGQATGRHFGKIISAIILLIGYLMMLWDDRSQTLHDKMAGSVVVNGSN